MLYHSTERSVKCRCVCRCCDIRNGIISSVSNQTDNNTIEKKWPFFFSHPLRTESAKRTAAVKVLQPNVWARWLTFSTESISLNGYQTVAVASHTSGSFLPAIKTISKSKFFFFPLLVLVLLLCYLPHFD